MHITSIIPLLLAGCIGLERAVPDSSSGPWSDDQPDLDTDANTDTDTVTDTDTDTDTYVDSPVDYCHLQWPCTMTASEGVASETVYGWIYQAGSTEGEGQGSYVRAQVGWGADGSIPDANWTWSDASYLGDKDGLSPGDLANDEYSSSFETPTNRGSYDYVFRFSIDGGGSWTYCDAGGDGDNECGGSGSDDGYSPTTAGQLTVE